MKQNFSMPWACECGLPGWCAFVRQTMKPLLKQGMILKQKKYSSVYILQRKNEMYETKKKKKTTPHHTSHKPV